MRGSIPAWAGEPRVLSLGKAATQVYPRVGGGTQPGKDYLPPLEGLSPRGRGNRLRCSLGLPCPRSIPAWAGEPTPYSTAAAAKTVYPRVGGGTVHQSVGYQVQAGLSPRGRGNQCAAHKQADRGRSIPAWAGEPLCAAAFPAQPPVYPRVGGGTPGRCSLPSGQRGLSPRGRGNPALSPWLRWPGRSIPAWAGEPTPYSTAAAAKTVYPRVGGGTSCA